MNLQRREEIRGLIAEITRYEELGATLDLESKARDAITELLAHIDTLEQTAAERVIADGSRGPTPDYTGEGSAWVPPAESGDIDLGEGAWISISKYKICDHGHRKVLWVSADEAKIKMPGCVEVRAVVVPDDDRPSREFLENYVEGFDPGERSAALFGWREGRRHLREHSRAIPAGRVPGEGMVGVDRRIIEKFTTGCHEWMPGLGRCGDQYPGGERQLCSKCAPLRAALRADQGGANE